MTRQGTWLTPHIENLVLVNKWTGETTCSVGRLCGSIQYRDDTNDYLLSVYDPLHVVSSNYGTFRTLTGAKRGASGYTGSKWTWTEVEPVS